MHTGRADLNRCNTHVDVTAVAAAPEGQLAITFKDNLVLNIGSQRTIALTMKFFGNGNAFHCFGNDFKALFTRDFSKIRVHMLPLMLFTGGGIFEIIQCIADHTGRQGESDLNFAAL